MSATNSVFSNDTAITLDWADVAGANKYQLQVSVDNVDFSGSLMVDDATLVSSTKAFTDTGTDNRKRYWRWRSSADGGTTWSEWSEVGSYWYKNGAAGDVTLAANKWAMFDPDLVTDIYTFDVFPLYKIVGRNSFRVREANRKGNILSEYITNKANVALTFDSGAYITHVQFRALKRFNEVVKTFFLATYKSNETDTVPNIWKVQFETDPELMMVASGRQGLLRGSVSFIEV